MMTAWATMAAYLILAMTSWSPTIPQKTLEPIANDIATVMLDRDDADPGDAFPPTLVAAIGFEESGWAYWVGDGSCNRPSWRDRHVDLIARYGGGPLGACDGGKSFSFWQVQRRPGGPSGWAMIHDRKLAIREAWRAAEASMTAKHGLCDYVGEPYPHCPKADRRMDRAVHWVNDHPFVAAPLQAD